MGAVALDASFAIGFLDRGDAHHERAVSTLRELDQSSLIMPASAYSETLVRPLATRRGDIVEQFVDGLGIEVIALDRGIARRAAELRAEHGALRLPDAVVLATALSHDALLLTFDDRLSSMAHAAKIDG